jgi:hypothetical protein
MEKEQDTRDAGGLKWNMSDFRDALILVGSRIVSVPNPNRLDEAVQQIIKTVPENPPPLGHSVPLFRLIGSSHIALQPLALVQRDSSKIGHEFNRLVVHSAVNRTGLVSAELCSHVTLA